MAKQQLDLNKNIAVIVESPNKCSGVKAIFKSLGFKNVRVVASVGHITYLKDVKTSWKNTGIYPEKGFEATFDVDPDKYKVVADIKAQVA